MAFAPFSIHEPFREIRRRFDRVVLVAVCLLAATGSFRKADGKEVDPAASRLEVRFRNESEIFSPKAAITLDIVRHDSSTPYSTESSGVPFRDRPVTLNVSLYRPDGSERESIFEHEVVLTDFETGPTIPVSFPAPAREGVYEIVVSLHRRTDRTAGSLWSFSANPLQKRSTRVVAETVCQCVVVNPNPIPRPIGSWNSSLRKELLETVDIPNHASRRRWAPSLPKVAALSTPKMPEMPKFHGFRERPAIGSTPPSKTENASTEKTEEPEKETGESRTSPTAEFLERWISGGHGPSGSGHWKQSSLAALSGTKNRDRTFSILEPSGSHDHFSWQSFPLTIREAGKPHLLEIDYPEGVPQTLGINLYDMLDGHSIPLVASTSGLHVTEEIATDVEPGRTATHRILFWPKTKQPMLFLVNLRSSDEACFEAIRLYRVSGESDLVVQQEEARLPQRFGEQAARPVFGYVHQAHFLETLAAPPNRPTDPGDPYDWQRLFEGGNRLIDLLRKNGYDGTMLNVASEKTILFPAKTLPSTPDEPASAPQRDGLELLFRLFDREQLALIPAVDFGMRLPAIEEQLNRNPALAEELLPVGANDRPQNVPRYNLLHPTVQEAMFQVVREFLERYGRHSSFGGLGVLLTPEGYAQLPDPLHDLDDRTIREFQRETGTVLPEEIDGNGPNRSPQRLVARSYYFQANPAVMEAWISWRARKVGEFYARLAEAVAATREGARLYLAGGTMLDRDDIRPFRTPAFSRRIPLPHVLRSLGFDLTMLSEIPSLTFLRPCRIDSSDAAESSACYADFDSLDSGLFGSMPGALFFHDMNTGFTAIPGGERNRRRFVKQLTLSDTACFFDGGLALPSGEEEQLDDLTGTFRTLPAPPAAMFQTFAPKDHERQDERSLQPVTVRYAHTPEGLTVYLVNDAPFEIGVEIDFSAANDTQWRELSGRRTIPEPTRHDSGLLWRMALPPYDLVAVRLSDPAGAIRTVDVTRPETICGPNGKLKQTVDRLGRRIQVARSGIVWDKLENPRCEPDGNAPAELSGWNRFGTESFVVQFDSKKKYSGVSSLKLSGHAAASRKSGSISGSMSGSIPGSIYSNPFPAPPTGRLFASIVVGIPETAMSLPLHVVLSAKHHGEPYLRPYRIEPTLLPALMKTAPIDGVRWHRIVVPFDRLPTERFEDVRIGFELNAPGTVWIDEVTLYQLALTKEETNELFRLVSAADVRCSTGRVSDLLAILEGYWARFLFRHVPERGTEVPPNVPVAAVAEENKPYAENAASRPVPSKAKPEPGKPEKAASPGVLDRIKGWFGR